MHNVTLMEASGRTRGASLPATVTPQVGLSEVHRFGRLGVVGMTGPNIVATNQVLLRVGISVPALPQVDKIDPVESDFRRHWWPHPDRDLPCKPIDLGVRIW